MASEPSASPVRNPVGFLEGGGQLGALMRAKHWSATPLGPPETWSPSSPAPSHGRTTNGSAAHEIRLRAGIAGRQE